MIGRVKLSERQFLLSLEWTVENLNDSFNEKLNILFLTPSNKKNAILRNGLVYGVSFRDWGNSSRGVFEENMIFFCLYSFQTSP